MEWVESTLGEICDFGGGEIKTGPFGSQLHQSDYEDDGTPVVMPKDIIDGRVLEGSIARVNGSHVERLSQHKLSEGDIVYGRRGDIGRQALVRKENIGWLCGTGCLRVTVGKKSPVSSRFLHLYLKQPDVITWVSNQAIGATMPNLNTSILRSVPVRFPEKLKYQDDLADKIIAYDNLIENNNRRIAILEDMAQSLYREWFVKFRFPGHQSCKFKDSPLGEIPEGWAVVELGEFIDFWNGKKCIKSDDGEFPVYGANGIIGMSDKPRYENGIVIGRVGAYCGAIEYCFDKFWGSDNTIIAKCKTEESLSYLFLLLKFFNLNSYAGGAAQPLLTQSVLKRLSFILPPKNIIDQFDAVAINFYQGIDCLIKKNRNLRDQRDLLLPKLITGKIQLMDSNNG